MDVVIQLIASCVGTLGFGFLFNIRGRKLFWAALGGLLSWGLFLALEKLLPSEPGRYFVVSTCSTVYAEILARRLKTPVSTFCIVNLIPLVPGGALYYTTTFALNMDLDAFLSKLVYTLELAVALSLGIVLVTAGTKLYARFRNTIRH